MVALTKNQLENLELRERIARLIRLNFCTDEIARRLRISQMIVRFHENKIREAYNKSIHHERAMMVKESFDIYRDIQREAYRGYQMSLIEKKADASFLRAMIAAQENICKLLGLNAPTKVEMDRSEDTVSLPWDELIEATNTVVIEMPVESTGVELSVTNEQE